MKFGKIWRALLHRAEPVICLPIRLDYSAKVCDLLDPNKIKDRSYGDFESDMRDVLWSVFGPSNIVSDPPATIIDVVETQRFIGTYGTHGTAESFWLSIKILRSRESGRAFLDAPQYRVALVAKNSYPVSPPPQIVVAPGQPQFVGAVKGRFPREAIEKWLKSFPIQRAD